MPIPLLVDDARAAIVQLEAILEAIRAANRKAKERKPFELPDGERGWLMFDSMPPWAFSGNPTQSSDHSFGSSPVDQGDNKGIERAKEQAARDLGKAKKEWERRKARSPKEWAKFVAGLIQMSKSNNFKTALYAKALLGKLRQWGLI